MEASADRSAPLLDLNSDTTRRACLRFILIFVLLGAIGRIKQYVARPSYWNDEAAVVINIIQRDSRHLLDRLDYAQAAPPAFLWAERGMYKVFGGGERSLRLLPLLLSLLSLPLFARLAWRTLPSTSACWATGWFCLFQKILHQGPDVKQYSGDICIAIVLLLIVVGTRASRPCESLKGFKPENVSAARRSLYVSLAAAPLLWFSFPVVFLYGALSVVLLPDCRREGTRALVTWLAGGALVVGSFLAMHRLALSHGGDPSLVEFWHASFPYLDHPTKIPLWLAREIYTLFAYPFDSLGALTTALGILGAVALIKLNQGRLLAVFALTLGLAFVAAAFKKYPFPGGHRLGRYLMPLVILILGAGAEGQNLRAKPWLSRWWWILAAPLLLLEVGQLVKDLVIREEASTMRPVVQYVREHRREDEPIYLFGDSLSDAPPSGRSAEFLCYWPDVPGKIHVGYTRPAGIPEDRFWLVYSLNRPNEMPFAKLLLEQFPDFTVIQSVQPRRQSGAILVQRASTP